jgi:hypothetical protein
VIGFANVKLLPFCGCMIGVDGGRFVEHCRRDELPEAAALRCCFFAPIAPAVLWRLSLALVPLWLPKSLRLTRQSEKTSFSGST